MPRHSLKSRAVIQALLYSGKRYNSSRLSLYYRGNWRDFENKPNLDNSYGVAFLLSGKSGNAVERNKIKRWLREDFRRLQSISIKKGAFAVRFKGIANNVDHQELAGQLEKLYNSVVTDG